MMNSQSINKKKFFGKALAILGTPPVCGIVACISSSGLDWFWAAPLAIITCPLLPFYYVGHNILKEIYDDEFSNRTKDLTRVSLPLDYSYIEKSKDGFLVQPFCYEGEEEPFETENDARLFLQCLHYHEVLSVDTDRPITFWIKDDSTTCSEKV